MSCPKNLVRISWTHPSKDVRGNALNSIRYTEVGLQAPGTNDPVVVKAVQYPLDQTELELPGEGLHQVFVRTVSDGVRGSLETPCVSEQRSEWTPALVGRVDNARPEAPTGLKFEPCGKGCSR